MPMGYAMTVSASTLGSSLLERDALLLFAAAIELTGEARARLVDEHCASNDALRARVHRLIAADEACETSLADPDATRIGGLAGGAPVLPPPTIGVYDLVELIGSGGMGSVYRARRNDGLFEQSVAIKFIRPRSGKLLLAPYMDAERRLLARMAHPGIARILDGGTTSNGLHYLVMELVNGRPLDQYVNMVGPALPARVALVRDVCDAVAHAHQNLVLHCDLKPANILVTATGDTRLIDFGVARGQDMDDARREGFTQGYSSPQRLAGLPAVTADDVYALGVVLRSVAPEGPLDLQAIIRRATAQAREDRYASADALRDDLNRWLQHKPVLAMGSNWRYATGRFVHRYPWRVASALVALLTLIAALLTIATLYSRADTARREAETRFAEVRALANFMLFDLDGQLESIPGTTRARRELVERGQRYLDTLAGTARDNTALRTEVARGLTRLGEVQGVPGRAHVGEPGAARASLQRAEALLLAPGNDDGWAHRRDLARAQYLLALIYGSADNDAEHQLAKAREAERNASTAATLASASTATAAERADLDLLLLGTRLVQADAFKFKNDMAAAAALQAGEEARLRALPDAVKHAMAFDYQVARPALLLGDSLWYLHRYDDAVVAYRRAIDHFERALAQTPADRRVLNGAVNGYWSLSGAMLDVGRPAAEALAVIDRGAAIAERLLTLDPDNLDANRMLGVVLNQRALILSKLGRHPEAIAIAQARLGSAENRLRQAPDDAERARDRASTLRTLAELHEAAGERKPACSTWLRAAEAWQGINTRWGISTFDRAGDAALADRKRTACAN